MSTSTWDGPYYNKKGTKQCQSSPISSTPCAQSWVSKTLNGIWFSSTMVSCTNTFKHKWVFWTSHHWEPLNDMLSKINKNSSKGISESLDLQMHHSRKQEKVAPTCRPKDKENITNLLTTYLSPKLRRVMERWRKTLGSGEIFIKYPGTTLMNSTQSSHR